ncbi:carbohydrate kinase [Tessaracoccus sp. HDW20]|nr:carbohydrate kinase [Tessaracoccus coleopterorum]
MRRGPDRPDAGRGDLPEESRWIARSGGGPMNTAVALAKLGEDTHFLGRLSTDSFGRQLRSHLAAAGVDLDLAVTTDDPTSVAVVSLDEEGKASYTFHFDSTSNFNWAADEFPTLEDDDWLHFGSIGSVIGPGARQVLDFVNRTEAVTSFDINVRPSCLPDRAEYFALVSDLMRAVGRNGGVVKASDEDIAWLVDDEHNVLGYAATWAEEYDLSLFIVTLGADGVAAVRRDGSVVQVAGHKVDVVDTVGAGDTFMAGFLSAYTADPSDLRAALARGAAAAAVVVTGKGAKPPTRAELDAFGAERPHCSGRYIWPSVRGRARKDRKRSSMSVSQEPGHYDKVQARRSGRPSGRRTRPSSHSTTDHASAASSSTCSRTRRATCTWATRRPTPWAMSCRATGACGASTSCIPSAGTRSACPPRMRPSRPTVTRPTGPTPTSRRRCAPSSATV